MTSAKTSLAALIISVPYVGSDAVRLYLVGAIRLIVGTLGCVSAQTAKPGAVSERVTRFKILINY